MESATEIDFLEQRKHNRVRVTDGLFVVPASNPTRLCQIIDLSLGGLAFYYFNSEDWKKKFSKADILFPDDGFCLNKIPIKNVSDFMLENESFSDIKRCGIKFGRLNSSQLYWLKYLISKTSL